MAVYVQLCLENGRNTLLPHRTPLLLTLTLPLNLPNHLHPPPLRILPLHPPIIARLLHRPVHRSQRQGNCAFWAHGGDVIVGVGAFVDLDFSVFGEVAFLGAAKDAHLVKDAVFLVELESVCFVFGWLNNFSR